jgi:hypothetical protein
VLKLCAAFRFSPFGVSVYVATIRHVLRRYRLEFCSVRESLRVFRQSKTAINLAMDPWDLKSKSDVYNWRWSCSAKFVLADKM